MEFLLVLGVLVVGLTFVAWQVIEVRNEIAGLRTSTTLFMTVESKERDQDGIPNKTIQLRKKVTLPTVVVPGMEYSIPGEHRQLLVTRVVFDDWGRGVHIAERRVPEAQVEQEAKSFACGGWHDATSQEPP